MHALSTAAQFRMNPSDKAPGWKAANVGMSSESAGCRAVTPAYCALCALCAVCGGRAGVTQHGRRRVLAL